RSVRLWIRGTNVVKWDSRRVTRSTVPRCEVQVVMITPGYVLAPLTGTPGPANARENPGLGRSSILPTRDVDNEATFTTFSLLSLC
ncbi:Lysosomal alpha-mannosidase, partial [Bienertia sinuspersici]